MNSQKATYWFALALAAFALNSEYQHGAFPAFHQAAGSARTILCRMEINAERTLAMARLMAARPTIPDDELPPGLEVGQLADAHQLSEDQQAMIRNQVRAQQEIIRSQMREYRSRVRVYRGQFREEMRTLPAQVRLTNSLNRRLLVVGPGNCKSRVEVPALPALPAADDDDDTF